MIDATEVKQRTGNGIAVCVEGDSYEDDAAYYRQWFESQSRRVMFFPADGWREIFTQRLQLLDGMMPAQLHEVVSGKYILQMLYSTFPRKHRGVGIKELKERYIDKCVAVPEDIAHLVERIETHATRYKPHS